MTSQNLIAAIYAADEALENAPLNDFEAEAAVTNLLDMLVARIFHLWDLQEVAKRGSVPHDVETELDKELASLIVVAKQFRLGSF